MLTVALVPVGALVAVALWVALRGTFAQPLFQRENYRKASVPVGAGVVLALAGVVVEAFRSLVDAVRSGGGDGDWFNYAPGHSITNDYSARSVVLELAEVRLLVLVTVVGFALLGLFDDLAGTADDKGFRGHLRAMARGRLTTGGAKLVLGGLLAVLVAARIDRFDVAQIPLDAAVIALAANLGNLFDRAPGRTTKVGLLAAVPLLLVAGDAGEPVAVVVGAAAGLLLFDLREELMLGDAGANALGAVLGLGVVLAAPLPVRVVVLVVLLVLNLASEKVSFSRVIDRTPPLRWFDRLGRRP